MSSLGTESSSSHERAVKALRARILHRQTQWASSARRRRPRRPSRLVLALRRTVSRLAAPVLRSPGLAAWGVTGAALAAFIIGGSVPRLWEVDAEAIAADHLLHRARIAVEDARRVLGLNLRFLTVQVEHAQSNYWTAKYVVREKKVVFNSAFDFEGDVLLDTAGHECVHAIFDQADLHRYPQECDPWTCFLIEETSAYVIGADIAGRVRERRGGDGAALRDTLIGEYRRACDVYDPQSIHQLLWRYLTHFGGDPLEIEEQISIHFPSASLVDEVAAICRSSRDPYSAARAVAGRYWPTPTPTPDP